MRFISTLLLFFCLLATQQSYSQTDTLRNTRAWNAQWIGLNAFFDFGDYYGVYCYRKTVSLGSKPSNFYIHISADNHYKLWINGNLVSVGPTAGDLFNWRYETVNIAKYLVAGKNSIAAQVWEEAEYRPHYQNTSRAGFILQGNTAAEEIMNTNNSWKCVQDKSIKPVYGYFVAVNGQNVSMNLAPATGWNAGDFDDSAWPGAANLAPGQLKGAYQLSKYMLVPSLLPQRELTFQPITVVRKSSGISIPPVDSTQKSLSFTVPANTKAIILLDQTYETNAYPTIKFSGGTGAGISLGYAETLYNPGTNFSKKGNRNDVIGKVFRGLTDTLTSNGKPGQSFTPFNFRTYRYIQLIVDAKSSPITIDSLYGTYTAYPFKQNAVFNSDDSEIKKILDIGWRTVSLNAWDTYTDCPYYERLQYIGDSRIQAMVSYFNSNDDLLTRNTLNQIDQSRLPEGITLSVSPTNGTQIIPPYSLLYIGMLHDYYMYRNDHNFIKDKLVGTRLILDFFTKYQGTDGSVVRPPYWNYVDGPMPSTNSDSWFLAVPPYGSDGSSAVIDMQLLAAYQQATVLENAIGQSNLATSYGQKIAQLKQTIQSKYYNSVKKLYADTKEQNSYSQHANAMAILTGIVSDSSKLEFAQRIVANTNSLTQCNIYFKYYLNAALVKAGLGEDYMNWLDVWRNAIANGLTTWPEIADVVNTRSDCHAWSASPNIEFYRTVLGIDTDSPGFQKIKIEPHLGVLTNASGSIPHPNGTVSVFYVLQTGNTWKINILLPTNTTGKLLWKGTSYELKAGENLFVI
ncbi:alpha-L-rhamnosidase-related protein [Pedobacter arcticus]|uniref:alpha-L-rhamnosidase-related protein n=1 Tax=Pedobacter arcticus TaxID=752140 RepID=UPI0002D56A6D|nr:alpha-L-rhamnosidase C-terminal domain-containing protein [Pedobacter arcticus]